MWKLIKEIGVKISSENYFKLIGHSLFFRMELSDSAIIGGIIPNITGFIIFCFLIIFFARTGRMAKMFGWNKKDKNF